MLIFVEQLFAVKRYGLSHSYSVACLVINILMGVGLLAGIFFYDQKQISLSKLYLLFGTIMGLVFMILIPIYVVPDEPVHIMSAYSLSNRMMGIKDAEGSTLVRVTDLEMPEVVHFETVETYDEYYNRFLEETGETSLSETRAPKTDAPFYSYLPAALGLTAGRLLGLNTIMTYMLGRLLNLLVFVVVMSLAIRTIPIGKLTVFIIGLMPMTLQEAASFSYDWFIICMSVLSIAVTLNMNKRRKNDISVKWIDWTVLALINLSVFGMKGHAYFSISLLPVVFLLADRITFDKKTVNYLKIAGIVIVGISMLYIVYRSVFAQGDLVAVPDNYLEYAGVQGYTIQYFINNPSRILIVLFGTIKIYDMSLVEQAVGNSLGWLEINVFKPVIYWFIVCLLVSPDLDGDDADYRMLKKDKIILLSAGAIAVLCIFAGMLLHWTPQESIAVLGVQGRYFIPTALLFLLPIKDNSIFKVNKEISKPICISVMFFLTILVELLLISI